MWLDVCVVTHPQPHPDKNLLCVHFYRTEHKITEHRINQTFQWKSKKFPSSWDWDWK